MRHLGSDSTSEMAEHFGCRAGHIDLHAVHDESLKVRNLGMEMWDILAS